MGSSGSKPASPSSTADLLNGSSSSKTAAAAAANSSNAAKKNAGNSNSASANANANAAKKSAGNSNSPPKPAGNSPSEYCRIDPTHIKLIAEELGKSVDCGRPKANAMNSANGSKANAVAGNSEPRSALNGNGGLAPQARSPQARSPQQGNSPQNGSNRIEGGGAKKKKKNAARSIKKKKTLKNKVTKRKIARK